MTETGLAAAIRRPSVRLVGIVGLFLAALISLFALLLRGEYGQRLDTAREDIGRLSRVLVEHTARTTQAADLELIGAVGAFSVMPESWRADRTTVGNVLKARLGNAPQIRAFLIVDAEGRNLGDTSGLPPPPSLAGREYFAALRDNPGLDLHVSRPSQSATTGKWFVAISRRLRKANGDFDGVAVAFVEPSYFSDLYAVIVAGSGNSIALVTEDGYLVARAPEVAALMGSRMSRPYLGLDNLAREPAGFYRAKSSADGVDRLVSFRKVAGLPLVVVVGVDVQEVLKAWYETAVTYAIVIVLVALAVGLLALSLFRQIRLGERSEALARQSARLLRAAIDSVPAGISIRDATTRGVLTNRAVRERFGIDFGKADGATATELFPPEVVREMRERERLVFQTGLPQPLVERTLTYPDGVTRTVLRGKSPVFADANPEVVSHVVTTTIDITERKMLERQVAEARQAAEQASLLKSQFLAAMSHELRTPLNAVIGFSEVMERRMFGPIGSPRYEEYLRDIHNSANHLLGIINDILDLSRIEAGEMRLEETLIDVEHLVRSCLRFVSERAGKARIELAQDLAAGLPAFRADQRKMKQVLINLLTNAVKFTPEGGQIVVRARADGEGRLILAVADTGIGISGDDLKKVLRPFQQASSTHSRNFEGTGLGLTITKSLVELHGGELAIESELGRGTTVTATLPASRLVALPIVAAS